MSHQNVEPGEVLYLLFPLPDESDDYTHVPGKTLADFKVSWYANGSTYSPAAQLLHEVTNADTGEKIYRIMATGFPLPGQGQVEVRYPSGKLVFGKDFTIDTAAGIPPAGGGAPSGSTPSHISVV